MVFNQEEICVWFKNLEGHARIELICTLLDICLPLELRFLGTYLEYFAGKHYTHLQKWEKDANNNNIIDSDTNLMDQVTRRRLCIFLALLHSHNRITATKFYMLLKSFEKFDNSIKKSSVSVDTDIAMAPDKKDSHLLKNNDKNQSSSQRVEEKDNQEESNLLSLDNEMKLLFTMASHHPAFEFWQRKNMRERLKLFLENSNQKNEGIPEHDNVDLLNTSIDTILITTKESPPPQVTVAPVNQSAVKSPLLPSPSPPSIMCPPPAYIERPFPYTTGVRPNSIPPSLMLPTGAPIHIIGQQNGPVSNFVPLPGDEKQTGQMVPLAPPGENMDLRNIVLTPMQIPANQLNSQYNTNGRPLSNYIIADEVFQPRLVNDLKVLSNGPIVSLATSSNTYEINYHKAFPIASVSEDKHINQVFQEKDIIYKRNIKPGHDRRCLSESEMYCRERNLHGSYHNMSDNITESLSINNTMQNVSSSHIAADNNAHMSTSHISTCIHNEKTTIVQNKTVQHVIQNFPNLHTYQLIMPQNKYIQPGFVQNGNTACSNSNVQANLLPHHSLPIFPINPNIGEKTNLNFSTVPPPLSSSLIGNSSKRSLPAHLDVIQTFDPLKPTHLVTSPLFPVVTSTVNLLYPPSVHHDSTSSVKEDKEKIELGGGATIPIGINGGYITRQMLLNGPLAAEKAFRKDSLEEENHPIKSYGKPIVSSFSSSSDRHITSNYLGVDKESLTASPVSSPMNSPCHSPSMQRRGSQVKEPPNLSSATDWLKSLRLHKYEEKFRDYTFKMMSELDEDCLERLGLTKGARTKLLQQIDNLRRGGFKEFGQQQPINHFLTSDVPSSFATMSSSTQNLKTSFSSFNDALGRNNFPVAVSSISSVVSAVVTTTNVSYALSPTMFRLKDFSNTGNNSRDEYSPLQQNCIDKSNRINVMENTSIANHVDQNYTSTLSDDDVHHKIDDDEVFSIPTKKRNSVSATCYNCGLVGHYGDECSEQTMEAQTFIRYAYHLDYSHSDVENETLTKEEDDTAIISRENSSAPPR